jgi:hypothetical protein
MVVAVVASAALAADVIGVFRLLLTKPLVCELSR